MASVRSKVIIHLPQGPAEFITFSGLEDWREHFAIRFKSRSEGPPLVRVHSECMTGDIFSSEHCDCKAQLSEAISRCSKEGGIIIYLRQEGRGIGLYNKLDAYLLQSQGLNTFEANESLGFPSDARNFSVTAQILKSLQIEEIRLLTNNPDKIEQISNAGIRVIPEVTGVYQTHFNQRYLEAKVQQTHHTIQLKNSLFRVAK